MTGRQSRRNRFASMPSMTPYNISVQNVEQRKIRPYHHDLATMNCDIVGSRTILDMVLAELKLHHINVSGMVVERFGRVLPGNECSREQLAIIRRFFIQPMLVPNTELQKINSLEPSGKKRCRPDQTIGDRNRHQFYIRSWAFSPAQLYYLVKRMKQEGFTFRQLDEWQFASVMAGSSTLTVRYIGIISGCRTALERFSHDLTCKSKATLLGAFWDHLERIFPHVFHTAEVHTVSDASLELFGNEFQIGSQFTADDTERLLIHMLGHHSLLNQQLGGRYNSYLPYASDDDLLKGLTMSYFAKFGSDSRPFPEHKWLDLSADFEMVRHHAYRMGYPSPDTPEVQAKPFQHSNATVFVFLGEELTADHLSANCSFIYGYGKSSNLVRNFYHRIKNVEYSNYYGDAGDASYQMSKAFTFVNLLPLPKYSDHKNALLSLQKYLQCVRPVILASFGQRTAETVLSHFKAIFSRARKPNIPCNLGIHRLSIHSYGNGEEDVFIHIPLHHPGSYQYGQRGPEELRFFYISIQFTFLVASCAIRVLEKSAATSTTPCRRDLCIAILDEAEREFQTGNGRLFMSNMDSARAAAASQDKSSSRGLQNELKSEFNPGSISGDQQKGASNGACANYHGMLAPGHMNASFDHAFGNLDRVMENWFASQCLPEAPDYTALILQKSKKAVHIPAESLIQVSAIFGKENALPILDEGGLRRLRSFGQAVGKPHSEKRLGDLEKIWRSNVPELHLAVPHAEEMRKAWVASLAGLQQGQALFLGVISQLPDSEYLRALLRCNQPRWLMDGERALLDMKEVVCEGFIRCGLWVQRKALKSTLPFYPAPFVSSEEMQGHPIGVKDDGELRLRWRHPSGINKTLILSARFATSRTSRDLRALSFTEHGLDIVDATGNPLRPRKTWSGAVPQASIPRSTFAATSSGQTLEDLWLAVLQANGRGTTKTGNFDEAAAHSWGPGGVKLLSTRTSKELPAQNRPPQRNDANFLLVKFLDERFPYGGIFRTAPCAKIPDSTEDLHAFIQFCQTPEYRYHPYSAAWLGILGRDNPIVSVLGKNIQIYRKCETKRHNGWQPHLRKMVGEVRYHLGAPPP